MQESHETDNKHINNELLVTNQKEQQTTTAISSFEENVVEPRTKNKNHVTKNDHIPRIGVICYVPKGTGQAFTFLPMLFGSWKYITSNRNKLILISTTIILIY